MEKLEQIRDKYKRLKEHTFQAYKQSNEDKKDEIVQLLIATVFERQEYEEYTKLCDEMF